MSNNDNRPVAIVTGAARGIGRAIAEKLSTSGYRVSLVDIDASVTTLADSMQSAGREAVGMVADVAELETHQDILTHTLAAFGRIDCLVNNAGVSVLERGDLLDVSVQSYDRCMDINARACFFLSQALARHFVDTVAGKHHRSIINISSSNAVAVSLDRSEYGVSKAAVSMMTKTFAVRLAPHSIGVYEIRPGTIETGMTAPYLDKYRKLVDTGTIAMTRLGLPEDVAQAVLTLADGGFRMPLGRFSKSMVGWYCPNIDFSVTGFWKWD